MEQEHKQLVIGILAHVDSGKTTLSEALLYGTGTIRKLGRVDHKDAFLDTDALEKARGITIFSKQALFTAGNTDFTLLDTPGHVDFPRRPNGHCRCWIMQCWSSAAPTACRAIPRRSGGCCGGTASPPLCS